jgi:hypothetical protein
MNEFACNNGDVVQHVDRSVVQTDDEIPPESGFRVLNWDACLLDLGARGLAPVVDASGRIVDVVEYGPPKTLAGCIIRLAVFDSAAEAKSAPPLRVRRARATERRMQ